MLEEQIMAPGEIHKIDENTLITEANPVPINNFLNSRLLPRDTTIRRINPIRYRDEDLYLSYQTDEKVTSPTMAIYIDVITTFTFTVSVYVDYVFDHQLEPIIVDDILSGQEVQDEFADQIDALKLKYDTDGKIEHDMEGYLMDIERVRDLGSNDEQEWELYCISI